MVADPGEQTSPLSVEPLAVTQNELLLRDARQAPLTLCLHFGHGLLTCAAHSTVIEVGCDDECCATRPRVAVHENLLAHPIKPVHVLTDYEHLLVVRASQVLPIPVECCDAVSLERFRIIRETYLVVDSVCAKGMLTRLLQVDHHADIQLEHLGNHVVLLHLTRAWPLRSDDFALDQVAVQAVDHWRVALLPLLGLARFAKAEGALEAMFALKVLPLQVGLCRLGIVVCERNQVLRQNVLREIQIISVHCTRQLRSSRPQSLQSDLRFLGQNNGL